MKIQTSDVNKLLRKAKTPAEVEELPQSTKTEVLSIIRRIYDTFLKCVCEIVLEDDKIDRIANMIDGLEDKLSTLLGYEMTLIILHSILEAVHYWVEYLLELEQFEYVVNLKKIVY
jgi:hypothetical protein